MNLADAVAALIPAYREASVIGDVVDRTRKYVALVLVVDDGSPDDTAGEARRAGAVVLRHDTNCGKGAALKTGFTSLFQRGFEYVVVLDGDGQHRPEEIPKFLAAALRSGVRLAVGNRMADTAKMPLVRRLTNRVMSGLLSRWCGQPIPDSQCGFRLLHRDLLPHLLCDTNAFDYESEILIRMARAGVKICSVPVTTVYGGEKSKIRPIRDTLRFFRMVWRTRKAK